MAGLPDAILVLPESEEKGTVVCVDGREIAFCEHCKYSVQKDYYEHDETGCTHQYMAIDFWTPRRVKKKWFCGYSEPIEKHLPIT